MKTLKDLLNHMERRDEILDDYTAVILQLCESLNCDVDALVGTVNELNLVERWLLQECKEPMRTEALEWLSKFGYEVDNDSK